ncbi:glycoside hydrolase family 3 N-terminal domain-containing protein [Amycolatopsis sp. NPDC051102]|uniref:glycoside hydrolase family 3 N-terminal domain-containing protein n=1 Tax=Amycolatopsis sp. NPDC051102 TaxID=3155163 RepID=UPI003428C09B
MTEFERAAHAVLLPVAGELTAEPWLRDLVGRGTRAVLIGETRAEYVARAMTPERRAAESAADFGAFTAELADAAAEPLLFAVDQEPWGIARLHDLVPAFPAADVLSGLPDEEIAVAAAAVASAARALGVTVFLAPVLDVLSGENPWLTGRTLPFGHAEVGRIAAAFVTGVQGAGVLAVAKHFPGHPELALDPALHDTTLAASVPANLHPFRRVVAAGVRAVMTGPVVVPAIDPAEPASTSAATVGLLRRELGFDGLVVSDDLDAPATTRGRSLLETVMAALDAGADLLLLPGGPELAGLAARIAARASTDDPFAARLTEAAARVRKTAETFARGSAGWAMS